ncbi:MAG: alpha/beta fold hydrolase [Alphaproteobacteria bacterium]
MFEYLIARAQANANVRLHASFEDFAFAIKTGDVEAYVALTGGVLSLSDTAPADGVLFTMTANPDAWAELRKPEAKPGFQTLSTMRRTQNLLVHGDVQAFFRHMLLLEMLFSNLSDEGVGPGDIGAAPVIEEVVGRYLHLDIGGKRHRLYFEEAGSGPALLCLHTAGSDGRQFRHLLNDPDVTSRFRVIAFDLPWHGKSSPPAGFEAEVYELTTARYVETIMAVVEALSLDRPVVMGCSIGGRAVLHLALRHGEKFRAAIGLQSALFAEDLSLGDPAPELALHRPDIHGGKLAGASMAGMIAPQSPSPERWETMWHYMQGGPGIFWGDVQYYFTDGDLRNGLADGLKDSACPLYLLSGEYDPSATPEMGRAVAELAGAAHFEIMRGMGHFPMSENPALFREYLLPVLAKIEAT